MPRYSSISFAAIAALFAYPAVAQDRADHFDGMYVGGTIGATVQSSDPGDRLVFDTNRDGTFNENVLTSTGADAFSPGFCNGSTTSSTRAAGCVNDEDALEYSLRIGVDGRVGRSIVGGLVLEGTKYAATDSTSAFSTTPASYSIARGLDYSIAARGRIGFTPNGGALFYVTSGLTYAKFEHDFFTTNTANAFTELNDGDWDLGGQVGGGAEVMLTDNLSLGLEYLYTKLDDDKYAVEVTQGTAAATNPFLLNGGGTFLRSSDQVFDYHSLKASLSFQF